MGEKLKPEYISDGWPGIKCQEDFDHDFKILMKHIKEKSPELCRKAHELLMISIEEKYILKW